MSRDTPHARTLYRAVGLCGGIALLAEILGVAVADLSRWLSGDDVPPLTVYLMALDIVAGQQRIGRAAP